jgi:hypothetical protein
MAGCTSAESITALNLTSKASQKKRALHFAIYQKRRCLHEN